MWIHSVKTMVKRRCTRPNAAEDADVDMVVVAKTRDNPTVRDTKVTRPTVNVAVDTMIKATARPMISSLVHVVNEDTSRSPRSVPAIVTTTHNVKAMIEATDEVVVKAIDKVVIEAFGKATIKDTDEDEADTGILLSTQCSTRQRLLR